MPPARPPPSLARMARPPHAGQVVRRVLLCRSIAIDAETAQLVAAAVQAALQAGAPSGRRAGARVFPPPTASRCSDMAPAMRPRTCSCQTTGNRTAPWRAILPYNGGSHATCPGPPADRLSPASASGSGSAVCLGCSRAGPRVAALAANPQPSVLDAGHDRGMAGVRSADDSLGAMPAEPVHDSGKGGELPFARALNACGTDLRTFHPAALRPGLNSALASPARGPRG